MISVQNLHKSYGKNKVLRGVNLECVPGKVYGIVGENGAGKTTLFDCLAGLESYEGIINSDFKTLKNHLGFFPTNPYFFDKITGKEYLHLLCQARKAPIPDFQAKNIFNLPLDQYASTYSTGMKKKLALLAILFQGNEIFILDEPFNGVDIQSNILIAEIIRELKALGKTVLISSHIFSTLSETCDEIHLLKEGVFHKKVEQAEFAALESEMKKVTIGQSIKNLDLK